ncbi:serine/threonine-protein kinase [Acidobacteria bacterium AH-259-L09]|nr:serine/threonine-protein kinase [Acidobacteria bacterium AH-259-L09]
MIGQTISHYKIIEKISEGGMGEVYRATDTKLNRDVALKVLPDVFAKDPRRMARFEREAQLLASLNHPNIAAIHGLEEADGVYFLVLELVEGETLAERVAKGPLPIEEALEVCRQIADGVEAAHAKGMIHRDLKPSNVKITPEGLVKVLDFGLAKAFRDKSTQPESAETKGREALKTQAGVILGTPAYMSPEQVRADQVDNRSDIWAFGCLLFEVITGQRAFFAQTVPDTLSVVLSGEPEWDKLPENTAWIIRRLLRRCLEKDPRRRLRDIGDARLDLEDASHELTAPAQALSERRPTTQSRLTLAWGLSVIVALALGLILGSRVWNGSAPVIPQTVRPVSRLQISLPPDEALTNLRRHVVAFSPDGKHVVYTANNQLYLRAMDQLEAAPIRGTEGPDAQSPFFSPDGQWVGFWAGGQLKKVSISGGASVTLCDAPIPFGASWGPNDRIVFGQGPEGIWQVPSAGGTKEVLISVDSTKSEWGHGPQILPGGKAVLFTVRASGVSWDEAQIVAQSLETSERKVLIRGGTDARYVPTGHLVYAREGTLLAVPFDVARLEVTGDPVPIVEGVRQARGSATGAVQFSFSRLGSLVYVPDIGGERTLVWFDRGSKRLGSAGESGPYVQIVLSPDEKRVAVERGGDIWLLELSSGIFSRFTFDPSTDADAIWSQDGRFIVYDSARAVYALPLFEDRKPMVVLDIPFDKDEFHFSPDGQWIAYNSNESGRWEVYVASFPDLAERRQVSNAGGCQAVWRKDGKELFYLQLDGKLMAVDVKAGTTLETGIPKVLFQTGVRVDPVFDQYCVRRDGQRFLLIEPAEGTAVPINIVLNWFEELKRLVPTGE